MSEVTAVVLFDRGGFEPCLGSLLGQEGVDLEVAAVVGGRVEPPSDPRVKLLVEPDRNPALRRNRAAAMATGEFLAFIDDDAFAPKGWLSAAVAFLTGHPEYAGVGGPNLLPPGAGFGEVLSDAALRAPYIGAGSRAYLGGGEVAEARPGEVHLVNLVVRRSWFERTGGLNEALGYGGEDTEFVYAAGKLGARFAFHPEIWVYHHRRRFGPAYLEQRFRLRVQSARLYRSLPGIYRKSAFSLALAAPVAGAAFLAALVYWRGGMGALVCGLLYTGLTLWFSAASWLSRPALLIFLPGVFFLHHLANAAGLWFGLLSYRAGKKADRGGAGRG